MTLMKMARTHRFTVLVLTAVVSTGILTLQCSSPTQTDSIAPLAVTPSSGVPGAALKVSGLTGLEATTDTLTATIGGRVAPVVVNDSGQVFVSIPLFLDDSELVTVPAEKLDLVITEKGTTLGEAKGAITVEALPAPARTLEDLSSALTVVANTLDSTLASFSPGPGIQEQYVTAIIAALDSLIYSINPSSLGSGIAGVNADSSLTYLTAILDANGVIEGFMDMASQLQAISTSAVGANSASNTKIPALHRSASPTVIPTTLTDQDLARRMQFYVIAKMFGETVISNTGQTFAETVGTVAGVIGISGVNVPYVSIVSAVLTLIDVVVNKIVVGALPATIDSMSVSLASDTINPGDATDASIYILTSNAPPGLGVQDIVGLTLTALGLFGDSQPIQSFKEVLWNTANFFVGMMQSTVAAYSAMHPELNLDVTVAAMPPMKWDAYIDDPHLVTCQSLTPSIVTGMTTSPNWKADDNNYGEGRIYVMPATGAGAMLLSLPPGFTYSGGAFGMDMTASRTISVWVKPALALQVDFATTITVDGANVLGLDAGYYDNQGNATWAPNINISLSVINGAASDTNGVTDAQGHFTSIITIDSTADSVMVRVSANGDYGSHSDTVVVARLEPDTLGSGWGISCKQINAQGDARADVTIQHRISRSDATDSYSQQVSDTTCIGPHDFNLGGSASATFGSVSANSSASATRAMTILLSDSGSVQGFTISSTCQSHVNWSGITMYDDYYDRSDFSSNADISEEVNFQVDSGYFEVTITGSIAGAEGNANGATYYSVYVDMPGAHYGGPSQISHTFTVSPQGRRDIWVRMRLITLAGNSTDGTNFTDVKSKVSVQINCTIRRLPYPSQGDRKNIGDNND